jgi:hypothetical protein
MPNMAFRTEALPPQLCKNHKRTEQLNLSENVAVFAKRWLQEQTLNKERLWEPLYLKDSPSGSL